MNNKVIISRTDIDGDNITIYFYVPMLSIDSNIKMASKEFQNQMSLGGFNGVGTYILKYLKNGISELLSEE